MLVGPFTQLITMDNLPPGGAIQDAQLVVIQQAGVLIEEGVIRHVGVFKEMLTSADAVTEIPFPSVCLPGFIDTHTHICFAGNRARDYAMRVSGVSYQDIAASGGGILDTVRNTRLATKDQLIDLIKERAATHLKEGVTTCEVKSGYGLSFAEEIKQLESIQEAALQIPLDLIPTCLAAHKRPPEFENNEEYLRMVMVELLPQIMKKKLSNRVDIFVDEHAFTVEQARSYLLKAREYGFEITMHADQFSHGGALLAAELKALSADHLEESTEADAKALKKAGVIPVVLPGACLGLGIRFPPARMLVNEGLPLVIASDWNPGSAPMGNLLAQAAFLGAAEHLSIAETFAGITCRAAKALSLHDRGILKQNAQADFNVYNCADYREILYYQGALKPAFVYKKGKEVVGLHA